jgi:RNA polymerase sigma factor (sigma-70 family)
MSTPGSIREKRERRWRMGSVAEKLAAEDAEASLLLAFDMAGRAAAALPPGVVPERPQFLFAAAVLGLRCGAAEDALGLVREGLAGDPPGDLRSALRALLLVREWSEPWLVACARADPVYRPALDVLLDRHWPRIFRTVKWVVGSKGPVGDLAHDAVVRLMENRREWRPSGNFGAYASTVAANICRDWWRRQGRLPRDESIDEIFDDGDGGGVPRSEFIAAPAEWDPWKQDRVVVEIDRLVDAMPARSRAALVNLINEETAEELAVQLGISENAAATLRTRAKQRLIRELGKITGK